MSLINPVIKDFILLIETLFKGAKVSGKSINLVDSNPNEAEAIENAIRSLDYQKALRLLKRLDHPNPIVYKTRRGTPLSAMYLAASVGQTQLVKTISNGLIDKNPKLEISGRTPLHVAAQREYLEMIEFISKCFFKENANPRDDKGITPLHLAATYGKLEALKILLSKNINKNPPSLIDGKTPLHFAAEQGNLDVVKELLKHVPDQVNDKSTTKKKPIDYAKDKNHGEVVDFLTSFDADVIDL